MADSFCAPLEQEPLAVLVINAVTRHHPALFQHGVQRRIIGYPTLARRVKRSGVIRRDERFVFPFGGAMRGATPGEQKTTGSERKPQAFFHGSF